MLNARALLISSDPPSQTILSQQVAEIEEAEKEKMRNKCKKIIDHGINVFINRQLIYNFPEQVTLGERTFLSFGKAPIHTFEVSVSEV